MDRRRTYQSPPPRQYYPPKRQQTLSPVPTPDPDYHRDAPFEDPWTNVQPWRDGSRTQLTPKKLQPLTRRNVEGIEDGRRFNAGKCILISLAVLIIFGGIAAGVTVYFLRKPSDSGECQVVPIMSSITFTYMMFDQQYNDKTSEEYQSLTSQFCRNLTAGVEKQWEVNECANEMNPCTVTSLLPGSIKVNFTIRHTSTSPKSKAALEKKMIQVIDNVIEDGRSSSLSDKNIFKQRSVPGKVDVGDPEFLIQCRKFQPPANSTLTEGMVLDNLQGDRLSWECKTGFKLSPEETSTTTICKSSGLWSYQPKSDCIDINDCLSDPCQNNAICWNLENGYRCGCQPGYTGVHCETKFDDCSPSGCLNGANCTDLENDYYCTCLEGFLGTHCETNIDDCVSNPCQNDGTCVDGANMYTCDCHEGVLGTHCETDIDECVSMPCQNNGTCIDGYGGYTCQCPGYTGRNCEIDINECASDPCVNGGACEDEVNGYKCNCASGWTGDDCSKELTECSSDPCQNGGTCEDLFNAFECRCVSGYAGPQCGTICTSLPSSLMCLPFDKRGANNDYLGNEQFVYIAKPDGYAATIGCGVKENCGEFDGTVSLDMSSFTNSYHLYANFSVSFWFKRTSGVSGTQGLVSNGCANDAASIFVTSTAPNKLKAGIVTENNAVTNTYKNIDVADDEWHHIALVYDEINVLLYIDNEKVDLNPAATGNVKGAGCPFVIGKSEDDEYFQGSMDEICLFQAGLNVDQVASLYYQPTQC